MTAVVESVSPDALAIATRTRLWLPVHENGTLHELLVHEHVYGSVHDYYDCEAFLRLNPGYCQIRIYQIYHVSLVSGMNRQKEQRNKQYRQYTSDKVKVLPKMKHIWHRNLASRHKASS